MVWLYAWGRFPSQKKGYSMKTRFVLATVLVAASGMAVAEGRICSFETATLELKIEGELNQGELTAEQWSEKTAALIAARKSCEKSGVIDIGNAPVIGTVDYERSPGDVRLLATYYLLPDDMVAVVPNN
jgi:hypothetical protein